MTAVIGWILIILLMLIGMVGAFVPIMPGVLSYFVYGDFLELIFQND